jgi:hypothetical protein
MTHEAPNQSYGVESTDQETSDRKAKKKLQNRVAQRLYREYPDLACCRALTLATQVNA